MRRRKSAYELARSQVDTPADIVSLFWDVTLAYRTRFAKVLDLGAGDGRFALGGRFREYVGVEIDAERAASDDLPSTATLVHTCAFRHDGAGYSACIGNPPYVRHHDLAPAWRDSIAKRIGEATGEVVNRKCNLYVYFLFLALLKARNDGLVAVLVPYEWVSRPAALPLRNYIKRKKWRVDTYRFSESIFSSVETTAAISVIDKRDTSAQWNFYSISRDGEVDQLPTATGTNRVPIRYSARGDIWAMRGMSPGTQDVFTLTEGQRIHAGLTKHDVYPCVTSLRGLPGNHARLTEAAFQTRYVQAGLKCWLIRSDRKKISDRLKAYLNAVPPRLRSTATCLNREPWYAFRLFDKPDLLVSSGFVGRSPKAVVNSIGAHAVGGVHGVYDVPTGALQLLQKYISEGDFSSRVVAHSGNLRKLEIKQLNSILATFARRF